MTVRDSISVDVDLKKNMLDTCDSGRGQSAVAQVDTQSDKTKINADRPHNCGGQMDKAPAVQLGA